MGLIFVGSSFAINMFARKLGRGGAGNGPATKRFFTQVAIVSVIIAPLRIADLAFFIVIAGRLRDSFVFVPCCKLRHNTPAIDFSRVVHLC